MSDKEQRVKWIGEQLHAGRIMLPVGTNTEWHREYLGEWADRPTGAMAVGVGVDLGVELSRGVVAHRCALCGVDLGDVMKPEIMAAVEQHHEVCEKRPIAPPDFVRWENPDSSGGTVWVDGDVLEIGGGVVALQVHAVSPNWSRMSGAPRVGKRTGLGYAYPGCATTIRRIPRPVGADEQPREVKVGDRVRIVRCTFSRVVGSVGTVRKIDNDNQPYRVALDGEQHGWWCQEVEHVDQPQPRGGQHEPAPVAALPATVLVDGLTRAQCLERFAAYHREDVGMLGSKWANLTPAQTAAAREEWSAALRAKVDATREAERNLVTYCEVDPWD